MPKITNNFIASYLIRHRSVLCSNIIAVPVFIAVKGSSTSSNIVTSKVSKTAKIKFIIHPTYTFSSFYNQINNRTFMLSDLRQAFRDIEASSSGAYEDLFEDFDVDSKDLGKTPDKRNDMLSSVIKSLAHIDFNEYPEDALGDAYEYLIAQFAAESGKKAGEFYTPQAVSKLIARIVTEGQNKKYGFSVYDPAMGSGSLLLQIRNYIQNDESGRDNKDSVKFYGQEIKNGICYQANTIGRRNHYAFKR